MCIYSVEFSEPPIILSIGVVAEETLYPSCILIKLNLLKFTFNFMKWTKSKISVLMGTTEWKPNCWHVSIALHLSFRCGIILLNTNGVLVKTCFEVKVLKICWYSQVSQYQNDLKLFNFRFIVFITFKTDLSFIQAMIERSTTTAQFSYALIIWPLWLEFVFSSQN